MTTVAIDHLRDALTARGCELGFDQPRSQRLADHFLDAEMRGARGHGAERMRWLHGLGDLRPGAAPLLRERSDGLARSTRTAPSATWRWPRCWRTSWPSLRGARG